MIYLVAMKKLGATGLENALNHQSRPHEAALPDDALVQAAQLINLVNIDFANLQAQSAINKEPVPLPQTAEWFGKLLLTDTPREVKEWLQLLNREQMVLKPKVSIQKEPQMFIWYITFSIEIVNNRNGHSRELASYNWEFLRGRDENPSIRPSFDDISKPYNAIMNLLSELTTPRTLARTVFSYLNRTADLPDISLRDITLLYALSAAWYSEGTQTVIDNLDELEGHFPHDSKLQELLSIFNERNMTLNLVYLEEWLDINNFSDLFKSITTAISKEKHSSSLIHHKGKVCHRGIEIIASHSDGTNFAVGYLPLKDIIACVEKSTTQAEAFAKFYKLLRDVLVKAYSEIPKR